MPRIAFDMTTNDMKQYTLSLSDESIFLNIPKSGSINVETRFGFTPYVFYRIIVGLILLYIAYF